MIANANRMNKIIVIGDLHGRNIWQDIVNKEKSLPRKDKVDQIIFMGDYFDSFDVPYEEQMKNFADIIAFKKLYKEKVILLFGNHEFHYMWYAKEKYSGYQELHAIDIQQVLRNAVKEGWLQMAYQHEQYLFTHAGVTQTWYKENYNRTLSGKNLAGKINEIFSDHPEAFRFTPSNPLDHTGDSITQSPIWVRPRALSFDAVEGFTHVVGHTHVKEITYPRMNIESNLQETKIIQVDTFDHCKEYLIITDGVPSVATL